MHSGEDHTRRFYSHLTEIAFNRPRETLLREDFRKSVEAAPLSDAQLDVMRIHASPTGADCISGKYQDLWHNFSDALKKRIMLINMGFDNEQLEGLKEIVIFTQWNITNYPMMMGFDLPAETPRYPASASAINTFPELLSYLRNSYLPAVKSHLANELGLSLEELEGELNAKEAALVEQGLPGIEIMRPIARESWIQTARLL